MTTRDELTGFNERFSAALAAQDANAVVDLYTRRRTIWELASDDIPDRGHLGGRRHRRRRRHLRLPARRR